MREWQKDLLFLVSLVSFLLLIVLFASKAEANPLKVLDDFHDTKNKPEIIKVPPVSDLEKFHEKEETTIQEKIPQKQTEEETKVTPTLALLDGFHGVKKKDTERVVVEEETPIKKTPVKLPPKQRQKIASIPFLLGHNATSYQSVWLSTDQTDIWLSFDFQLTKREFEKFPKIKTYLEGLELLDPKFLIGFTTQLSSGTEKPFIYTGGLIGFKKGPIKGFKVKALVFNNSYRQFLKTTVGRVSIYYFYDKPRLFRDSDFASFYLGWVSPVMNVNLSNIEEFKENFRGLRKQSENLAGGLFYLPSIASRFSFNIETNLKIYSFSLNYLF